jgi:HlyD family secretion protein
MKKIVKWGIISLAIILFVGTFIFLFQKSQPVKTMYEINTAIVQDIQSATILTGKIEPRDEVNIKPQISGIITELYKDAGETVSKNEVIAKVKVIPDMGNLNSAENRVRLAEISFKQAKTDFERMKRLYEEKVISTEEYEKAEISFKQAKLEKSNAEDALNIVRDGISLSNANMSTTLIRSTIDGLILDIPVKVGNSVILSNSFNDGTTIATVADMSNLIFRGKIDETEVGRIHENMPVKISVGAIPDLSLEAVLEYISPKATEENGANLFEVKAAINVPNNVTIRSGYSANAEIVLDEVNDAITIPESSLEFSVDSVFVHILADSVKHTFIRKQVVTGISDGVNIEIKEGLNVNDTVRGIEIKGM